MEVTISDVNDNFPVFEKSLYFKNIPEDTGSDHVIEQVSVYHRCTHDAVLVFYVSITLSVSGFVVRRTYIWDSPLPGIYHVG